MRLCKIKSCEEKKIGVMRRQIFFSITDWKLCESIEYQTYKRDNVIKGRRITLPGKMTSGEGDVIR